MNGVVKQRLALAAAAIIGLATAILLTAPQVEGPLPTPSPRLTPVPSRAPASLEGSWWALDLTFVEPSRMSGFRMVLGVLGERPTVVERAVEDLDGDQMRWGRPRAGGPDSGQVAYSFRSGAASEIWLLDAATGRERKVATRPSSVAALDLDVGDGFVYSVETTIPPTRFVIARTDIATGSTVALTDLEFDDGHDGSVDARLVADTSMLVVLTCGTSCRVAGIRTTDGIVEWDRPTEATTLIGGISGAIGAMRMCGLPCPAKLIDAATGESQDLGRNCEAASLTLRAGQPVMVTDTANRTCRGRGEGSTIAVYRADKDAAIAARDALSDQAIVVGGVATGYSIDPGWALLSEGGSLASAEDVASVLYLFDVESGEIISMAP